MHVHARRCFVVALGLALGATAGCKRDAPPPQEEAAAPAAPAVFSVSTIELGRGIGPDKRVTAPATTFKPRDTIYVSVATEGSAPSKSIGAKWTYEDGQVVNEATEDIAPTGPAATEFHIAKASGWPAGKYKVEVSVDGSPAGSKDFEVKP
ncbi:MAG TPA: hypothetical protein VMN37_04850 [Gemmatimonadales bacterium]|nr:hypothetical protein [Gemmatimonadales bacterium]